MKCFIVEGVLRFFAINLFWISICPAYGTVYKNCAEVAKEMNVTGGQIVNIDPLGGNNGGEVTCDEDVSTVYTIVHHDSEARTQIPNGNEAAGSYSKSPVYPLNEAQFAVLRSQETCKQHLKFECVEMSIYDQFLQMQGGGVVNYNSNNHPYYPCTCIFKETCDKGNTACICHDTSEWKFDEGYITDYFDVPIQTLRFGDTGSSIEQGYHTLGPLVCTHLKVPELKLNDFESDQDTRVLTDGNPSTCVSLSSWKLVRVRLYLTEDDSSSTITVNTTGTNIPSTEGTLPAAEQGFMVYVDTDMPFSGFQGKFELCDVISSSSSSWQHQCSCSYGTCRSVIVHLYSKAALTSSLCEISLTV